MPSEPFIFAGFPLEGALAERIAVCPDALRPYVENPMYLETVRLNGTAFIGKRIEVGLPGDRLEDAVRSVMSMIARVAPGLSLAASDARLLALEERRPQELQQES